MKIFIKAITGMRISVDVDVEDSLAKVKDEVHAEEGIHPDHQLFIFCDNELMEEELRLCDSNVQMGSTLHLLTCSRCKIYNGGWEQYRATSLLKWRVDFIHAMVDNYLHVFVKHPEELFRFDAASELLTNGGPDIALSFGKRIARTALMPCFCKLRAVYKQVRADRALASGVLNSNFLFRI